MLSRTNLPAGLWRPTAGGVLRSGAGKRSGCPGEARRQAHAAVLIDTATQAPVRCLWRGLPDLPKGLKHTKADQILEQIERKPRW